jgi:hypothetical protein
MLLCQKTVFDSLYLAAQKPSANLGTRVGGGASGATSQLTQNIL